MNSERALLMLMVNQKKLRDGWKLTDLNTLESVSIEECYEIVMEDLEIVECFRKIPKQDLKDFIEWQIRYEKNLNTWLEGCNCDLGQEDPTKHLIKIKEWLDEKEKEERMEND